MMPEKELTEITAPEWAIYYWHTIPERTALRRGGMRLPKEAIKAHAEFEEWSRIYRICKRLEDKKP